MASTTKARAPRVLVADDEDNARLLGRLSLEQIGCEVVLAADGSEALAAAAKEPPDMVLLNVIMPGMDGFEVCRRLRARPATAETPIVVITGLDDIDAIEKAYEVGATDFITKPVSWTLLQHRVRFVLRASNAIQDLAPSSRSGAPATALAPVPAVATDELAEFDPHALEQIHALQQPGQPSLLDRVIGSFLESAAATIADLQQAARSGDAEALRAAAHGLKAASGNVGARRMMSTCRQLEVLGRSGSTAAAAELLPRLDEELATATPLLQGEARKVVNG